MVHRHSLFWRIFAVNAGLLGVVALLLLLSPVEIEVFHDPAHPSAIHLPVFELK